jgi:hypothetical protein
LPSFYSLWQTLAGRAINDTQPLCIEQLPHSQKEVV